MQPLLAEINLLLFGSAATAFTAAALHVVVADGAGSLLHDGSQFTDAVADADAEALHAVAIIALADEAGTLGSRGLGHVLLEEVAGKCRESEALVQERLIHTQTVAEETASLALQHHPRRLSETVQADAPVARQGLLYAAVGEEVPAVVAHAFGTFYIRVRAAQIRVDAGAGSSVPVDVSVEAGIAVLTDVGISGVEHILARGVLQAFDLGVGHQGGDVLDAIVGERIACRKVDVELLGEVAITQVEGVVLLAVQPGVSLTDVGGVAVVQIGIEVPNARTVDAHIVAQTKVGHIRQLPSQGCRRHYVVEVLGEVVTLAYEVLHILNGMFVAHTEPAGKFFTRTE